LQKETDRRHLAIALGFSAGVMIYVSFVELLPAASDSLDEQWIGRVVFFLGMIVMAASLKLI
jgi:ZIP family zinc transporter